MTIGDAGGDAEWLSRRATNVTSTSISTSQIQSVSDAGHLPGVRIEQQNAEAISLADGAVDFIYCKEAFHHFPRPMVGLYEMLRVSRVGVALCEPFDDGRSAPLAFVSNAAKRALRKGDRVSALFEDSGNFIYRLSLRETYKVAAALQFNAIYYRFLSDFFVPGLARKPRTDPMAKALFRLAVGAQDLLCTLGLLTWGRVLVVIAKQRFDAKLDEAMRDAGFKKLDIPRNPYI